MQANDLNKLVSSYHGMTLAQAADCLTSCNDIYVSTDFGGCLSKTKDEVEKLNKVKVPISKELFIKVRSDVKKFEELGKSRRWIRRYIKRKHGITEY